MKQIAALLLGLIGLFVAASAAAQAPEQRAEYRALRYLLAQAPARKAEGGMHLGTPYLTVAGGERIPDPGAIIPHGYTPPEPPGFDAVHVTIYGPGAEPWDARGADQTSVGTVQPGAAPGGGALYIRFYPYVPVPERRTPYSDGGNPASLAWSWSYREHRLILTRTWGGEISEADAMGAIRPLAELVHRGFVEDGLADGGTAAAPGRYRATIRIPPLTPGEVLSPSVDVVDENGKPPADSIYVSWYIDGVNTPSVVWDGRETRVEVQVSVANQALVEAVLIPAFVPGGAPADAVPTAPTLTVPDALPGGPVPGMTGVGPMPGPGSLGQALVGTLLPPLLITLGQLLAGVRGGAGVPPLPVAPPKPNAPAGAPPAAPTPPPARPAVPAIDPVWKQRLDRLEQVAKHDRNGALAAAVQTVRSQLGGPRDPKAWAAAQQQLKDALGQLDQALPKPNGVGWDAAASVVGGVRDTAVQAGGAIRDAGGAIAGFPGSVWQGLKGIGNGLLNPGHFVAGVNGLARDWVAKNLKTESQAFVQGLKDGKLGAALGALGQGMVKAAGSALGAAWEKVGKSVLPVDELKSFNNPHASLEEKLWAVPAAAVKIAGILVGLQKPTPQPSTAWGQAIRQGLQKPVPPPVAPVAPKPKLPGPVRARPVSVEAPPVQAPAAPRPVAEPTPPARPAPASPPAGASAATPTPSAPPPAPKKRFFQGAADGSDIEILPPSEITPSNHSSVVGDISLESIHRAEHWRFFKVDRAGIRMLEPGAGVEDLCDVLLPKNKRLADITDTDIVVCTSDARKAAWIRTQVRNHINQILRG